MVPFLVIKGMSVFTVNPRDAEFARIRTNLCVFRRYSRFFYGFARIRTDSGQTCPIANSGTRRISMDSHEFVVLIIGCWVGWDAIHVTSRVSAALNVHDARAAVDISSFQLSFASCSSHNVPATHLRQFHLPCEMWDLVATSLPCKAAEQDDGQALFVRLMFWRCHSVWLCPLSAAVVVVVVGCCVWCVERVRATSRHPPWAVSRRCV